MSQYTELIDGILVWTKKPLLTAEMDLAIRNAINAAHRADKFPRDLVSVDITGLEPTRIQSINYTATPFERFRMLAAVGPTGVDLGYNVVDALDLFDQDGYARENIAYVAGTNINIRAVAPATELTVQYYQRPDLSDLTELNDWIVDAHQDLIVLWAAASILTIINEQEIKTRVEKLAVIAYQNLLSDAIESGGR